MKIDFNGYDQLLAYYYEEEDRFWEEYYKELEAEREVEIQKNNF